MVRETPAYYCRGLFLLHVTLADLRFMFHAAQAEDGRLKRLPGGLDKGGISLSWTQKTSRLHLRAEGISRVHRFDGSVSTA